MVRCARPLSRSSTPISCVSSTSTFPKVPLPDSLTNPVRVPTALCSLARTRALHGLVLVDERRALHYGLGLHGTPERARGQPYGSHTQAIHSIYPILELLLKGIYSEVRRGLAEPCMREDVLVMAG